VTLSQAEREKKMETYGVIQGGVLYEMMSKHGRLITITLPCHMAAVHNDLIGANEQGPMLKGIGGVMYFEYTRPDGRRGSCMQMPDGEIVPLPADDRGLTVLPEIGQEKHWSMESYPMDIEELCELLMSRERIRRMREAMPDLASDSVMPAANGRRVTCMQMPDGEVVGLPTEAHTKPIVTPGSDAQAAGSELPWTPSGRLTEDDFTVMTDCSVCHMVKMTAPWVWQKSTLLDADGIVHNRSAQMLLDRAYDYLRGVLCMRGSRWRYVYRWRLVEIRG
jgi:hypothetical protein